MNYCVILCGGSGTRLWPLSRRNYAKQFLRLYSDNSLLQETYFRARKLLPSQQIYFVTNRDGFPFVFRQIQEIEKGFDPAQIIIEPASLNTAPALAAAVKYLISQKQVSEDDTILSLHADHYIRDTEEYVALVQNALESVGENIGTIGIQPTRPETGYGYIRKGDQQNGAYKVLEFCEKPSLENAKKYLASGTYVWNSGMYIFGIKTFLREIALYVPEISSLMREEWEVFLEQYPSLTAVSIDTAVSEKSKHVIVYEGNFGWSDIGSFDSLAEISGGTSAETRHIGIDSKNVFVHSASDRLIATIGIEDIAIIETTDSILVYRRGRAEEVKKVVERLKASGAKEIEREGGTEKNPA